MGNSTGNANKKTTKTSPNDKKKRDWNKREEGTGNIGKNNSTTWGNKTESTGQRRKTKEISTKGNTIQTKQDIPKQRKKLLSLIGREWHENIRTTGYKRNRTILDKNMATKESWRKCWMDKQYHKRTRRIWRRPRNGNTYRLTQNNPKKNIKLESTRPWRNTWLLVQEIHLHSRQTSTRNEHMLTRRASTWMDDQRKDDINSKGP